MRTAVGVGLLAYLMITAGVVWLIGAPGLIACGGILLTVAIFVDFEEGRDGKPVVPTPHEEVR